MKTNYHQVWQHLIYLVKCVLQQKCPCLSSQKTRNHIRINKHIVLWIPHLKTFLSLNLLTSPQDCHCWRACQDFGGWMKNLLHVGVWKKKIIISTERENPCRYHGNTYLVQTWMSSCHEKTSISIPCHSKTCSNE